MNTEHPRVFIPHDTVVRDRSTGEMVPRYDFTPAEDFGRLVVILPTRFNPARLGDTIPKLHDALDTLTPDDSILLTGSPILLGLMTTVAFDYAGKNGIHVLQWDRLAGAYARLHVPDPIGY